jgi:hypothetical protein
LSQLSEGVAFPQIAELCAPCRAAVDTGDIVAMVTRIGTPRKNPNG